MERYIITGQEKELERVLREQRIRVSRGLITITPISECGLVAEEDARKTLEDKLSEKDSQITELTESNVEKDKCIDELTTECESMKARIEEFEVLVADSKNLPADDSKKLSEESLKTSEAIDDKNLSPDDEKKIVRKSSK